MGKSKSQNKKKKLSGKEIKHFVNSFEVPWVQKVGQGKLVAVSQDELNPEKIIPNLTGEEAKEILFRLAKNAEARRTLIIRRQMDTNREMQLAEECRQMWKTMGVA